jgi:hypothetical protein
LCSIAFEITLDDDVPVGECIEFTEEFMAGAGSATGNNYAVAFREYPVKATIIRVEAAQDAGFRVVEANSANRGIEVKAASDNPDVDWREAQRIAGTRIEHSARGIAYKIEYPIQGSRVTIHWDTIKSK